MNLHLAGLQKIWIGMNVPWTGVGEYPMVTPRDLIKW